MLGWGYINYTKEPNVDTISLDKRLDASLECVVFYGGYSVILDNSFKDPKDTNNKELVKQVKIYSDNSQNEWIDLSKTIIDRYIKLGFSRQFIDNKVKKLVDSYNHSIGKEVNESITNRNFSDLMVSYNNKCSILKLPEVATQLNDVVNDLDHVVKDYDDTTKSFKKDHPIFSKIFGF